MQLIMNDKLIPKHSRWPETTKKYSQTCYRRVQRLCVITVSLRWHSKSYSWKKTSKRWHM